MKPILRARLNSHDSCGLMLDCGDGTAIRIVALADDLIRITALRGGEVRQKRTWAVPAFAEADTDWVGRARLDDSSWPTVATEITASPARVELMTRALRLTLTLDGFRMDWALPDGTIFARDREIQPYCLGQKTHAFKHAMARALGDRHYGLGDKTGPLDLTGRRLRCAMRDALGFDPERGDPLYKNWPFLIVRDAASGVSHGVFYDNCAEGSFDLGCEHDNYFGRYRAYEAEDGDLDFYLILGPRLADVTAKFVALTGRTALPPRWSLGFAQTAMALADAPDAQAQIQGVIDAAKALDVPISSFHFGSGYTSIGKKRYVFTWNRAKFPEPTALMRAFADAGMKVVANVKPCLLDDHPRYSEVAATGGFIAGGEHRAPLKSQFWDGEGAHVDFTNPAGVAWWKESLTRQVLDAGVDAGWNDNNEYGLWDDDATCAGFGEPTPLALMRPVQALLDDARDARSRARREAEPPPLHRHARRRARPAALCPDLERRQHDELGVAEMELSHRPRHVALRHVQHRP